MVFKRRKLLVNTEKSKVIQVKVIKGMKGLTSEWRKGILRKLIYLGIWKTLVGLVLSFHCNNNN